MAHEIAHVAARHGARQATRGEITQTAMIAASIVIPAWSKNSSNPSWPARWSTVMEFRTGWATTLGGVGDCVATVAGTRRRISCPDDAGRNACAPDAPSLHPSPPNGPPGERSRSITASPASPRSWVEAQRLSDSWPSIRARNLPCQLIVNGRNLRRVSLEPLRV
jgi:peptidase M48-like protein